MIYTEITPNPASLKFVTDRLLIKKGTADFESLEVAEDAPIVQKLFDFRFTERVFIGKNFITLTKGEDFSWEEVIPSVKAFLKAYFDSSQPVLTGKYEVLEEEIVEKSELEKKICDTLDQYIRPAVAQDGGDIIYQGFEDGVVKLRMQGSCSGCPSSTLTLKAGIEGLLTRMIPEVKEVVAV